jgi:hypothetical protein
MAKEKVEPIEDRPGKQMDDNIDDLGRKPDGTTLDQPTTQPREHAEPSGDESEATSPGRAQGPANPLTHSFLPRRAEQHRSKRDGVSKLLP